MSLPFPDPWSKAADIFDPPEIEAHPHLNDPVGFVQHRLGEFVWSKQIEILESIRDNRRTAVKSCHGPGKSFIAARAAAWWIEVHPIGSSFVATSAPTGPQVKAILWKEIGRTHAKNKLIGRTNQTEWWIPSGYGNEEMVAYGRKPADYDEHAFQGVHSRFPLVVLDEACGIPATLWEASDNLLTNDDAKILAIGNPDDPTSEFAEVCKPGSGWNIISISAFDTPNFTGEYVPDDLRKLLVSQLWVDEKERKWGKDNPMYIAKVLGEFPESSDDGLISIKWVKAAQERDLAAEGVIELGCDVGGGLDRNVIYKRHGPVARLVRKDHNPDTMQSLGNLMRAIKDTGATRAKVDSIGIGAGMCDRAHEMANDPTLSSDKRAAAETVVPVKVSVAAINSEDYVNLRAEGYWGLRERFREGIIDIDFDDEDLVAQLVDIKTKPSSTGRIQIESKEQMKKRGKSSPDEADALMLAFLEPPIEKPIAVDSLTFGRKRR